MFARQAFRSARAIQQSARRAASTAASSSGPGAATIGLGAVALLGGGYYYTKNKGWKPEDVTSKAKEVVSEAKTAVTGATSASADSAKAPQDTSDAPNKAFQGGKQGFIPLVLESVETVNHNTKHFRFKLPDENDVSGLAIASAILTKFKGPEMEKPCIRPYTPTSDEDSKGYIDLVVKKYQNGPMSEHMHKMEPGQSLDFKGPIPKYPWSPNKHEHVTLIAGGTGITPMWQIARAIFKNPEDKTKVSLVFGNVTEEDILLKKEWEELENTYPQRFKAFYTVDKPSKDWKGEGGFINKELLQQVLPEPKEGEKIKIFVCGPPGLYKAISGGKKSPQDQGELDGILKELGYSKEQVYKF